MKVRTDFVTNSSSSSFIVDVNMQKAIDGLPAVCKEKLTPEEQYEVARYVMSSGNLELLGLDDMAGYFRDHLRCSFNVSKAELQRYPDAFKYLYEEKNYVSYDGEKEAFIDDDYLEDEDQDDETALRWVKAIDDHLKGSSDAEVFGVYSYGSDCDEPAGCGEAILDLS